MRRALHRIVLLSVMLAAAGSAPALAATPAEDAAAAQARMHYQKAASLYELGRYQEAIPEYEAAFQLKNDPAFLYNLAQCHRLAGNLEQALHFYRRYLVKDVKETKAALRADAESRIAQLEKLIAQKNVVKTPPNEVSPPGGTEPPATTAPPPGATIPTAPPAPPPGTTAPPPETAPPLPTPGASPPGAPSVVATAPAPATNADAAHGHKIKMAGVITIVVSGAIFAIGAVEGGRAVGAANDINNAAKAGGQQFNPAVESRGKSAQSAEIFCLVVGALGGAAGGLLYFIGNREEQAAARVSMAPMASADSMGALLRVTY